MDTPTNVLEKPLEERFRAPDGSLDTTAAQAHLQQLQARGADLSSEEIRDAITLVRMLRRTNTGPAASKKPKGKAVVMEPDDLLDL